MKNEINKAKHPEERCNTGKTKAQQIKQVRAISPAMSKNVSKLLKGKQ